MAGFIIYIYIYIHMTHPIIYHWSTCTHGCPFYQAGISSLWGSDLSLLQRLWYFAPRKAEQVSNRLRGKPGKMSTYLNMNIIWLEKKIYALILNCLKKCRLSLAQMPGKKSVRMLATWLLLMSRVDKSNQTCSLTSWTHLQERMTVIFPV